MTCYLNKDHWYIQYEQWGDIESLIEIEALKEELENMSLDEVQNLINQILENEE